MRNWESLIASRMRPCATICKIEDAVTETTEGGIMNAMVKTYMEQGMSRRKAYRLAKKDNNGEKLSKETAFDYESECPKGEWV